MSHESAFNRRTKELEKEFHQEELAELKAELARLTALLEDRQALSKLILDWFGFKEGEVPLRLVSPHIAELLADRIRAYLKEQK